MSSSPPPSSAKPINRHLSIFESHELRHIKLRKTYPNHRIDSMPLKDLVFSRNNDNNAKHSESVGRSRSKAEIEKREDLFYNYNNKFSSGNERDVDLDASHIQSTKTKEVSKPVLILSTLTTMMLLKSFINPSAANTPSSSSSSPPSSSSSNTPPTNEYKTNTNTNESNYPSSDGTIQYGNSTFNNLGSNVGRSSLGFGNVYNKMYSKVVWTSRIMKMIKFLK